MTIAESPTKGMKAFWADPDKRAAFIARRNASAAYSSPERGAKIAAKAKARWADPEFKARVSKNISTATKGRVSSACKPLTLNDVRYPSRIAAARALGVSTRTIKKMLEAQA